MSPDAKRRVRVSGGEMAVVDAGDPRAPAVVFVHGFPTSSFLWRSMLPMIVPAMRAIAPDLLGAGDSDKPFDAALGVDAQAAYLAELLETLPVDDVAVVGHGVGAAVGARLVLDGRARVLVVIDGVPGGGGSRDMSDLQRRASLDPPEAVVEAAFDAGMGHRDRLSADAVTEYIRPYRGDDGAAALARLAAAFDGSAAGVLDDDPASLDVPVFLLWGEDDRLAPVELAERLNDAIATSSLALLPGCGHFLPEDAPQTVGPLVYEYLRGTYAGLPHVHAAAPTPIELGRRSSTGRPGGE